MCWIISRLGSVSCDHSHYHRRETGVWHPCVRHYCHLLNCLFGPICSVWVKSRRMRLNVAACDPSRTLWRCHKGSPSTLPGTVCERDFGMFRWRAPPLSHTVYWQSERFTSRMFTMLMTILERHLTPRHILDNIFPTPHVNATLTPALRVLYLTDHGSQGQFG